MKNRGFTLIEALIYIALFALIIGGFVATSYMFFETSDRNQTKAMLQEEKNFLIDKIDWVLNQSKSVTLPARGGTGSELTVVSYDTSNFRVATSSGNVLFNGRVLNNANVSISRLVFIHSGTDPEYVETGFVISARTPNGMLVSEAASTTRYLRK